ncbi:hypothetical protein AHMF7605_25955 [Adhaeribacter arboris]|uniref:Uncharacterized protein n=1 Tax=Adhaeribacter arboris TaxID=2072846 RepID=A0A2T2YMF9_9BACT|nr:hypothetical protein [Adhaeribacter arboris]PSR56694.1 hypothetical protein AHMF7605_25955 [Adhaeribacter arboris]
MKLREKYSQLQDEEFVRSMVIKSVYGSMQLENQGVSMDRLQQIYTQVNQERKAIAEREKKNPY